MSCLSVGILGASGYTGAELIRLLHYHPKFSVTVASAYSEAGKHMSELYPHLGAATDATLLLFEDALSALNTCDLIFSGLPHGAFLSYYDKLTPKVVDLSSDFRLKNPADYTLWYGKEHSSPEVLEKWTYGLPELFRTSIAGATHVANPGCFATTIALACAPAASHHFIETPIVVDACSGTSGAGKTPKALTHFSHEHENVVAYRIGGHQHTGEIEQTLSQLGNTDIRISMTTQLVPMSRGIHAVCSAQLKKPLAPEEALQLYQKFYTDEPFVTVSTKAPHSKYVRGTNNVLIYPTVDTRTERLIITAVTDNLVKGAAGQAIQNANLICGIEETTGLLHPGLYP